MLCTVKFFHQLWLLKQYCTLHQILKVRIDTGTDACVLSCPLTAGNIYVIANLVAQ